MPDVAQALLIPSSDGLLDLGTVLSAMLIWDRVLIPQTALVGPTTPLGTRSLAPYVDAGAAVWLDPIDPTGMEQSVESAFNFVRGFEDDFPAGLDKSTKAFLMVQLVAVASVGDHQGRVIQESVRLCEDLAAAPVASGSASFLSAALPAKDDTGVNRNGRLMSAALQSVVMRADTPAEKVLRFRDEHSALRGRFRAAMNDLVQSLSADASPAAALEQARATVANRVEPLLGDLERAMDENRIAYFWRTLSAGAAVAAGPVSPGVATSGAATFITHSLGYAFNRRRLVSQHPYGFLRTARQYFGSTSDLVPITWRAKTVTDPVGELRELWATAWVRALNRVSRSGERYESMEVYASALAGQLSSAFQELETAWTYGQPEGTTEGTSR